MLQPQERFRSTTSVSDSGRQVLNQLLRGLDIEYKRTSTCIHLASEDIELVDSLRLALDRIVKTQEAVRKHLENQTARAAPHFLAESVTETRAVRDSLWPEHYRSCEALTRLLDILELAQQSLGIEITTFWQRES